MADFSLLDRPHVRAIMFYPRRDRTAPPAGASDLFVQAEPAVTLHLRVYAGSAALPTVLLFHGNGEVAADYDDLAPLYQQFGLNLLVSDYRGYGASGGSPGYTTMMADAHAVKRAALSFLDDLGWQHARLLMGRSLGALSAVELAATDASGISGLIMESGAANLQGWSRFAATSPPDEAAAWEAMAEAQRERLAAIRLPLLTIHGADDDLIPVERALEAHAAAGSASKDLLVVPGAGHNDLLAVAPRAYFEAITAFAARCEPD